MRDAVAVAALVLALLAPGPAHGQAAAVRVGRIGLVGNTVLPAAAVDEITAKYLDRDLTADDLEELRRRLTLAYVDRGYVTSGAILPEQDVASGVLTYRAIEGGADAIDVTGTRWLHPEYVRARLARAVATPLNVNDLQRGVQLLLQDPNIEQLNVELRPGVAAGEARIEARAKEAPVWGVTATIANDQPPDIGSVRGELGGTLRNLIGIGDTLALGYGRTEGANIGSVGWSVPVTDADTTVNLGWSYNGAGVVSDAFRGLAIHSRIQVIDAGVSQPLYRSLSQTLIASLGLSYTINDEYLLGQPFSFSPGYVNGHAEAAAATLTLDWVNRGPTSVVALHSSVSRGLAVFGADGAPGRPNADYISWLGQGQYTQAVFGGAQLVLRGSTQLATAPLYPFQQIAIGGPATVRGYVQNALVRDNGVIASIEARIPVASLRLPIPGIEATDGELRVAPFVDAGRGWNNRGPTPAPGDIASIGVGLQWDIAPTVSAQIYYGYALSQFRGSVPFRQPISFMVAARF